ncbi:hypothetical protein HanIR_Chr05g0233601 [Helianthus annuus]|nr:hypothetical protein HanIR_Chr05g0233601 [Helianthus annuus]
MCCILILGVGIFFLFKWSKSQTVKLGFFSFSGRRQRPEEDDEDAKQGGGGDGVSTGAVPRRRGTFPIPCSLMCFLLCYIFFGCDTISLDIDKKSCLGYCRVKS